jgi:hypothetical protein
LSKFYVHMIESPSPDDLFARDLEGQVLSQALGLSRIEVDYHIAASKATFWQALAELLPRISSDNTQRWPILHLSAHGSPSGLQLTNTTESIRWTELTGYLQQINDLLQGKLILAVSSCHGTHAIQEALTGPKPYYALVASADTIPLSDLAVGFTAFYHMLNKTWDLNQAYNAMVVASGNSQFSLFWTDKVRSDYRVFAFKKEIDKILAGFSAKGVPYSPPPPLSA